ncbi:hypothetical protein HAX54_045941 [Datura stramonium]|uniref:H(+)-transporting two-sector ATPase n=1 Tax=Datura stramonium TaxID=4076 RepID=A0ABS8SQZ1_DATST|nr:hypothetical protein [Datura stramonium]
MGVINCNIEAHGAYPYLVEWVNVLGKEMIFTEMKESGVINEENIAGAKTYFYLLTISSVSSKQDPKYRPYWVEYLPMVDPLDSNVNHASTSADRWCEEQYETAQRVKQTLQRYKELQDIIAILGLDAVDPLDSTSTMLQPRIVGEEHYETAQRVKQTLQHFKELQDIIAILGLDELSEEDRLLVARA